MSSNKNMTTGIWDRNHKKITTKKGGWRVGDQVYSHGYNLLEDLVGEVSFFQQMIMDMTGQLPERRLAEWLEGCYHCSSWPDSRIWCNQMGSLAGTSRARKTAGVCAGVLASESAMYGPGTAYGVMDFLEYAMAEHRKGVSVPDMITHHLKTHRDVAGFARPVAKGDERVDVMQRLASRLGFEMGEYETLVMEISEYLTAEYDECVNYSGYVVAFLADQGYSKKEIGRITALIVMSGVLACYVEANDKPAGTFLPMRCDDIVYTGVEDRELP